MYQVGVGENTGVYVRRGVPLIKKGVSVIVPEYEGVPRVSPGARVEVLPTATATPGVPGVPGKVGLIFVSFGSGAVVVLFRRLVGVGVALGNRIAISPCGTQDCANRINPTIPANATRTIRLNAGVPTHCRTASENPSSFTCMLSL